MKSSISSKLQWSFAGLCEGILPDSMRRLFSDSWTREAHLPKEYTKNPPGSPGGHVRHVRFNVISSENANIERNVKKRHGDIDE